MGLWKYFGVLHDLLYADSVFMQSWHGEQCSHSIHAFFFHIIPGHTIKASQSLLSQDAPSANAWDPLTEHWKWERSRIRISKKKFSEDTDAAG